MKTALKSVALGLLISSSCGFAGPNESNGSTGLTCKDALTIAVAVYAVQLAVDAAHHYVLAPMLKNPTNTVSKALEAVRQLLDHDKNRNTTPTVTAHK